MHGLFCSRQSCMPYLPNRRKLAGESAAKPAKNHQTYAKTLREICEKFAKNWRKKKSQKSNKKFAQKFRVYVFLPYGTASIAQRRYTSSQTPTYCWRGPVYWTHQDAVHLHRQMPQNRCQFRLPVGANVVNQRLARYLTVANAHAVFAMP